jgi:hypothetical protein
LKVEKEKMIGHVIYYNLFNDHQNCVANLAVEKEKSKTDLVKPERKFRKLEGRLEDAAFLFISSNKSLKKSCKEVGKLRTS